MRIAVALLLVMTLVGCKGSSPAEKAPQAPAPTSAGPDVPAVTPTAADPHAGVVQPMGPRVTPEPEKRTVKGKIVERIDLPSGMYLRLATSAGETWAAVGKADVKTGAEVTVVNAITMDGFQSASLNRKFDRIVFGALEGSVEAKAPAVQAGRGAAGALPAAGQAAAPKLKPGAEQGMPSNVPPKMAEALARMGQAEQPAQAGSMPQMPPGMPPGMPPHPPVSAPADSTPISVAKAEGAEGKTVAEIYAGREGLKDAVVLVRARVVKFSRNIMGKNWMHLRDGSGSPATQDHDMTVTTADSAAVGDVVLVRGVVHLNKDFGAGYAYPVIIEDAKVSK